MTVLLVGGTGRLGRLIAEQLVGRDEPLRALVRSGRNAGRLRELGFELEVGDLYDARSLRRVLNGVRAVVTAAQGDPLRRRVAPSRVDRQGNRNLIGLARDAGVAQFIFISALKADEGAAAAPQLAYKHAAESLLQTSGMAYTILRPATFQETLADPRAPLRRVAERFGFGLMPGGGSAAHSFVAAADVARAAALALDHPQAQGQVAPIGGPDDLSYREAYARIARITGWRITALPLPWPLLSIAGLLAVPAWPELRGALAWFAYLERAGGACTTPDWLAEALGRRQTFDEGMRAMYLRRQRET
ncbi:MAG TPA: NAD(P)H-binding protein [Roseiflexaceae bacterium]|nr:NAD(P)H-binding protein [Roseiflexaceae bacterium]